MKLLDIGIDYGDLSALILSIGACLALVGAVVIYKKWSMGGKSTKVAPLTPALFKAKFVWRMGVKAPGFSMPGTKK